VGLHDQRGLLLQALQTSRRFTGVGRFAQFRQGFPKARRVFAEGLLVGLLLGGIGQHRSQHGAAFQAGKFRRIGAHLAGEVLLARGDVGRALQVATQVAGDQKPAGA
jgi:hypothetical protein